MAITREKKRELVEEYSRLLESSRGHVLVQYSGVTVKDLQNLRSKLREVGGEFHIVKNSLMSLAMQEAGLEVPEGSFDGTTAIGFARDDIPAVAKAIVDLAKEVESVAVKGAIVEGHLYNRKQVEHLAELPPLPVVQAQFLGLLQAPGRRVASTVAASVRQVLNVLKAYSETEATTAPSEA